MAKSSIKLIDKEEIIPEKPVIPECNIQELILERNAFSKAAKERDDKIMILQENKMSDLNIRNNKLTKENIDFKSKIELLNNSIKIKDDTIKSKDNDIRQLTIAANNYKQELVSIKQQLAAKPNPMELNALRQRLADIK
jgi:hypothetical protein